MSSFTPHIDKATAADELRDLLSNDGRVYVLQRSVAKSGMSRRLSLFTIRSGDLVDITVRVAAVLGYTVRSEDHTIRVNGVGMDMHFYTVYTLSRALYTEEGTGKPAGYELSYETI